MPQCQIDYVEQTGVAGATTAVSLHSHTSASREALAFLPVLASNIPVVSRLLRREMDRYLRHYGRELRFDRAFWQPPLSAAAVVESETRQIEGRLGLDAIVSVTDHDTIAGTAGLRAFERWAAVPLSVEWNVPFQGVCLHLGVHNMPADQAPAMMAAMASFTARPRARDLGDLLGWLADAADTLVVLNHPLWNGHNNTVQRRAAVHQFIARHRGSIHALELNGFRSWDENRRVVTLAELFGLPLVAGGDRHGRAPNTLLNLTRAATFADYAAEVRGGAPNRVLVLPEYREHLRTRTIEAVAEVLESYPQYLQGEQHWMDRVWFDLGDGARPVSSYWADGGPLWVRLAVGFVLALGSARLKPARRLAFASEGGRL